MPIPKLHEITLPLLQYVSQQEITSINDAVEYLADFFKLTTQEKQEMLPSGADRRFANRVAWARAELVISKMIQKAGTGKVKITDRGKFVLTQNPGALDRAFFRQYSEDSEKLFNNESFENKAIAQPQLTSSVDDDGLNPEEALEESYSILRKTLASELLLKIMDSSPTFFEKLVVDLLLAIGYGGSRKDAGESIGKSGEGGIDGIIKEDKLGLDTIYIQAKRYAENNVIGRPAVQGFAGSLEGFRAGKGVFITTSRFTKEAIDYVERIQKRIILINGMQLCELMIDHNVGVSETARYVVKKLDSDYFELT